MEEDLSFDMLELLVDHGYSFYNIDVMIDQLKLLRKENFFNNFRTNKFEDIKNDLKYICDLLENNIDECKLEHKCNHNKKIYIEYRHHMNTEKFVGNCNYLMKFDDNDNDNTFNCFLYDCLTDFLDILHTNINHSECVISENGNNDNNKYDHLYCIMKKLPLKIKEYMRIMREIKWRESMRLAKQ